MRISKTPETPITATTLALESRDGDKVVDQAIIVSCDLVAIREGILQKVRAKVQPQLKDFDARKLFLSATHTHTAPVTQDGKYNLPADILQPGEYAEWMTSRVAEVVVEAWRKRAPGKVGWGQGQAVVAQNRRSVFADGSAVMYGKTDSDKFRGLEGYEDHNLQKGGDPGALPTEIHVLRLGDVAIASNQFELFTDYGVQMKARSPAVQTFLIQLAGPGTYLCSASQYFRRIFS